MSALRELAAILGIEVQGEENVKQADKAVDSLIGKLKAVGRVVAEAFLWNEARQFLDEQVQFGVTLERTSEMLGVTTRQFEAYTLAAQDAGLAAETMQTGLYHLNYAIGEALQGGKQQAQVFAELGIHLKDAAGKTRDTSAIMGDLADKIAATEDPAKKTQIAMQLLGRYGAALIPVFNQGRKAFADAANAMNDLGGPTTQQFIDQAKKVQAEENRLSFAFERVKQTIALRLFPVFSRLIKSGIRWAKSINEFAKQTTLLKSGLEALAVVASFKTAASLFTLAQKMGLIRPTARETVAALGRFAIPLAIIAALYLLFDDFYNLMTGGKSVIGDVLDQLFGLGTAQEVAIDLTEGFGSLFDTLEDIVGLLVGPFIAAVSTALAAAKDLATGVSAALKGDLAGALKAFEAPGARKEVGKFLAGEAGLARDIATPKQYSSKSQRDRLQEVYDRLAGVAGPNHGLGPAAIVHVPRSSVAAGAGPHTIVNQQNKIDNHITTADKPEKVGDAAGSGTATGIQKANNNAWNSPTVRKL